MHKQAVGMWITFGGLLNTNHFFYYSIEKALCCTIKLIRKKLYEI